MKKIIFLATLAASAVAFSDCTNATRLRVDPEVSSLSISGKISCSNGQNLNVRPPKVTISSPNIVTQTVQADANGVFTFIGLPPNSTFTIEPQQIEEPNLPPLSNAMTEVILGIIPMPITNLRFLAGDLDRNGVIEAADMVSLRRALIGLPTDFKHWLYVPNEFLNQNQNPNREGGRDRLILRNVVQNLDDAHFFALRKGELSDILCR